MKTINIKFCDRRRIKRLKRKMFLVSPEGFNMTFHNDITFWLGCDPISYESKMVVIDKSYFFRYVKKELSADAYKRVIKISASRECYVSRRIRKDTRKSKFAYFVFDNERSYIKYKLLS